LYFIKPPQKSLLPVMVYGSVIERETRKKVMRGGCLSSTSSLFYS
jgi:hypothetical protein